MSRPRVPAGPGPSGPRLRTAAVPPPLTVTTWTDRATWDAFVLRATDARAEHLWSLGEAVTRAYGHGSVRLAAVERGRLVGVLPLVLVRSRLLGRRLVSMPFMDYGGLCSDNRQEVDGPLVRAAVEAARDHRASLELRHLGERAIDLPASRAKATLLLDLGEDEGALWAGLRSQRRGQVRKGGRNGLVARLHGPAALERFYRVHAENQRDHGAPVHSRRFFAEVLAAFGDRARIVTVEAGGEVLGAAIMIVFRDTACVPWAAAYRAARPLGANQVLYWEAMRAALAEGCRTFDFGRSSPGTGPFAFKEEWGARPVPLSWHYFPEHVDPPGEEVRRLEWATRVWKRLPVGVATLVGPPLRRGIPN